MGESSVGATRVRPELNEANIKTAQPGDVLRDPKINGLQLRCLATKKSFYLYYRTKAGIERRPHLGDYGTISLAQARKIAGEYWTEIGAGRDPSRATAESRLERNLADLWDEYWKRHASKKKTNAEDKRIWEKFFRAPAPKPGEDPLPPAPFNAIALSKLSHLEYTHMADTHEAITKVNGPIQANRVLALLSAMLNFGMKPLEWLEKNPAEGVKRNKETKRRRYMAGDEAARIAQALNARAADSPASVAFLYLLILTGARKGEIAKARWDQIQGNKLVLSEHKTDQGGQDRVIHLPQAALDVLAKLPKTTGTITGIQSPVKLWQAVREDAGCPDLRMHDLRHSFASAALASGISLDQIGELLGHGSEQTTKRYAHLIDEAASAAASSAADHLVGQMGMIISQT